MVNNYLINWNVTGKPESKYKTPHNIEITGDAGVILGKIREDIKRIYTAWVKEGDTVEINEVYKLN